MNPIRKLCIALSLAAVLAGCTIDLDSGSVFDFITIHDGNIAVHAKTGPDAIVDAAGDLSIDGKEVALTPVQRDLLKQYYAQVLATRDDGIATGKAGAAMAGHAIGSVASGLAHGNPDSIGPAIDAHAKQIEAKAMAVCNNVVAVQTKQNAIASALPAFKPYALIDGKDVSDCRSHND